LIKPIVLRQAGHKSGGGATLATALGIPHSAPNTPRSTKHNRLIINWGVSTLPVWKQKGFLYSNHPNAIAACANKLLTLRKLRAANVPCLEGGTKDDLYYEQGLPQNDNFTYAAERWLHEDGKVVVRHIISGHSGNGLEIVRRGNPIPAAPLYTRYFKKQAEYRVHVAFGNIVLIQQKKQENGHVNQEDGLDDLVRTHDRGWIFCVNDLSCDKYTYRSNLIEVAKKAIEAVGAQHGAVDILVRHKTNNGNQPEQNADGQRPAKTLDTLVVCEINSAPAIRAGSTLEAYSGAFRNWIDARRAF